MREELDPKLFTPDTSDLSGVKGVGTIILNSRHELLLGEEKLAKPIHERQGGQVSIPLETFKVTEPRNLQAILLAGLSEVMTEGNIPALKKYLKEAALQGPVTLSESGVKGILSVLHWEGDPREMPFEPSVPGEFDNLHWMSPDEAVNLQAIRPYARAMIHFADQNELLNGLPTRTIPVLHVLNVNRYHAIRQDQEDIRHA